MKLSPIKLERSIKEVAALNNLYYEFCDQFAIMEYENSLKDYGFKYLMQEQDKKDKELGHLLEETKKLVEGFNKRVGINIENAAKEYAKAIWDREGYEVKLVSKNEGADKNNVD